MNRRDVLKTAPAAAAAAGLAGCSSVPFLGGGCSAPSGSPSEVLPSGGDSFTQESATSGSSGIQLDGLQGQAQGVYADGDGNTLTIAVLEFESSDSASGAAELLRQAAENSDTQSAAAGGLLQTGSWLVTVGGPSESKVRSLVAASAFGDGCTGEIEFVTSG
jgi:hypothetical protein